MILRAPTLFSRLQVAVLAGVLLVMFVPDVPAQTAKPAPAMELTEHRWQGGGRSSSFNAHWTGSELKMIREELAPAAGHIEKNEYFFNAGALLHYKHDRYPEPGRSGSETAIMVSFDKSGKPSISMKRIDGKPAGPATAAEIEQGRKHLGELQQVLAKAPPRKP